MGEKKDLKNMSVEEIKEYLKPTHSEVLKVTCAWDLDLTMNN